MRILRLVERIHFGSTIPLSDALLRGDGRALLRCFALFACFAVFAGVPVAHGQSYPTKPIKLITSGAPGSIPDAIARPLAEKLSERLGQPVVVENRPGAGGIIAMNVLAKSRPDGYTIGFATRGQMVYNSYLFEHLSYDPRRDFIPVINLLAGPGVIVVHPSLPVRSLSEFIAFAKARPNEIHYAVPQLGSPPHLFAMRFSAAAKVEMLAVPYRGGAEALSAVLSGEVPVGFDGPSSVAPHVTSGRLRAIAVTGVERSKLLVDTPTMAEGGFRDFGSEAWSGLVVPSGVAARIVDQLNRAASAALQTPDLRAGFEAGGFRILGGSPEDFTRAIEDDHASWGPMIRDAGIRLEP